jgi:hypothetical protein
VIHLAAGLRESRSLGAIQLYFEQQNPAKKMAYDGRERHSSITALMLERMLKSSPGGTPGPLVILDVPRPPGQKELARQLFLRNIFATELGTSGAASSVLATGLVQPADRAAFEESFVRYLKGGAPLFQFQRALLAQAPTQGARLEDLIGPASTVLFTVDPLI